MINLNEILPIVMYITIIVLLIYSIRLIIRLMATLEKIDRTLDDVNSKSKKLNGIFDIIDSTADGLSKVSDLVVNSLVNGFSYIFKGKKED
jgi:uncharacterized protein YoxC